MVVAEAIQVNISASQGSTDCASTHCILHSHTPFRLLGGWGGTYVLLQNILDDAGKIILLNCDL